MDTIIKFSPTGETIKQFSSLPEKIYGFAASEHVPSDAACYLLMRHDEPHARLTLRTSNAIATIGHYEALDAAAGTLLLTHALENAKDLGATQVIAPMNGTTWERYRLALPLGPDDPQHKPAHFTGEPINPPEYPEHFLKAGFQAVDFYESRITADLTCRKGQVETLKRKMEQANMTVAHLDMKHFDAELEAIFNLSLEAFSKNRFYQPISFEQFRHMYTSLKKLLDPELIFLARDKHRNLQGFVFAYPDITGLEKGEHPKRLVLKTLAVLEKLQSATLAIYLMDLIHLEASKKGYHSVIHALMHSDNNSLKLSLKGYHSQLFRRYALFSFAGTKIAT